MTQPKGFDYVAKRGELERALKLAREAAWREDWNSTVSNICTALRAIGVLKQSPKV